MVKITAKKLKLEDSHNNILRFSLCCSNQDCGFGTDIDQ
jgi:hypothetical protein